MREGQEILQKLETAGFTQILAQDIIKDDNKFATKKMVKFIQKLARRHKRRIALSDAEYLRRVMAMKFPLLFLAVAV